MDTNGMGFTLVGAVVVMLHFAKVDAKTGTFACICMGDTNFSCKRHISTTMARTTATSTLKVIYWTSRPMWIWSLHLYVPWLWRYVARKRKCTLGHLGVLRGACCTPETKLMPTTGLKTDGTSVFYVQFRS